MAQPDELSPAARKYLELASISAEEIAARVAKYRERSDQVMDAFGRLITAAIDPKNPAATRLTVVLTRDSNNQPRTRADLIFLRERLAGDVKPGAVGSLVELAVQFAEGDTLGDLGMFTRDRLGDRDPLEFIRVGGTDEAPEYSPYLELVEGDVALAESTYVTLEAAITDSRLNRELAGNVRDYELLHQTQALGMAVYLARLVVPGPAQTP